MNILSYYIIRTVHSVRYTFLGSVAPSDRTVPNLAAFDRVPSGAIPDAVSKGGKPYLLKQVAKALWTNKQIRIGRHLADSLSTEWEMPILSEYESIELSDSHVVRTKSKGDLSSLCAHCIRAGQSCKSAGEGSGEDE